MSNLLKVCQERGEKVLLHKCTSMRPRLKIKLSHIPLLQSVKISTWPSELLNWTETLHLLETHRQSCIYTQSLDCSLFVIIGFSNTYPLCGKTIMKQFVYSLWIQSKFEFLSFVYNREYLIMSKTQCIAAIESGN